MRGRSALSVRARTHREAVELSALRLSYREARKHVSERQAYAGERQKPERQKRIAPERPQLALPVLIIAAICLALLGT